MKEYCKINLEEKMTSINLFYKIFRPLIILFFILFTFSSFNVSSYILGQDNICSSEKNDIDEKCENNCLCDRDQLIHAKDSRKYFFNKSQINNHKTFLTKTKPIEEKANSPPII